MPITRFGSHGILHGDMPVQQFLSMHLVPSNGGNCATRCLYAKKSYSRYEAPQRTWPSAVLVFFISHSALTTRAHSLSLSVDRPRRTRCARSGDGASDAQLAGHPRGWAVHGTFPANQLLP